MIKKRKNIKPILEAKSVHTDNFMTPTFRLAKENILLTNATSVRIASILSAVAPQA
jgi:hypothetical protein